MVSTQLIINDNKVIVVVFVVVVVAIALSFFCLVLSNLVITNQFSKVTNSVQWLTVHSSLKSYINSNNIVILLLILIIIIAYHFQENW